jgi:3-methyladenine DNA glycosylase AlkD
MVVDQDHPLRFRRAGGVDDHPVDQRTVAKRLRDLADPAEAAGTKRYFKDTGNDRFLGIRAPVLRALAREYQAMPLAEVSRMLDSPWHEERSLALLILVRRYKKEPDAVYELYFEKMDRIDNWDLVDVSARDIAGAHGDRGILDKLARSDSIWKRRIAIVATQYFIKRDQFEDTLRIARTLLGDREDLIHKAVGWMLREVGDRDGKTLRAFLTEHAAVMPRTMLRYAIEKFPETERQRWLKR